MRPFEMVVLDVLADGPPQRYNAEHDHAVKALLLILDAVVRPTRCPTHDGVGRHPAIVALPKSCFGRTLRHGRAMGHYGALRQRQKLESRPTRSEGELMTKREPRKIACVWKGTDSTPGPSSGSWMFRTS